SRRISRACTVATAHTSVTRCIWRCAAGCLWRRENFSGRGKERGAQRAPRVSARLNALDMKSALHWLAVTLLMLASTAALANGRAYEAPLPAGLSTDPELCAHAPCGALLPGVDSYSMRKGRPPYVEAYRTSHGERRLVGYVFLSSDILDTPGYSGQPIVTLIGMDTRGLITGAEVLRHTEPIL